MDKYSLDQWRRDTKRNFSSLWHLATVVMFAASPMLLVYQGFQWLKTGAWPDIDIYAWWAWQGSAQPPHVDWIGLQRILDSLLSLPLWLVCPVIGGLMVWTSVLVREATERKTRISK